MEHIANLTRQDLADIWQGIMPEQSIRMLGKSGEVTVYGIDHALIYGETGRTFLQVDGQNTGPSRLDNRLKDLIDVHPQFDSDENANCFKPEIQWLVFKVKQKGIGSYQEMIKKEITPYLMGVYDNETGQDTVSVDIPPKSGNILERGYNWPYDYFSFVEMAKMEGQVRFRPHVSELEGLTVIYNPPYMPPPDSSTVVGGNRAPQETESTFIDDGGPNLPEEATETQLPSGDGLGVVTIYNGNTDTVDGHNHGYTLDQNKTGSTLLMSGPRRAETDFHVHKIVGGVVRSFDPDGNPLNHTHAIRFRD